VSQQPSIRPDPFAVSTTILVALAAFGVLVLVLLGARISDRVDSRLPLSALRYAEPDACEKRSNCGLCMDGFEEDLTAPHECSDDRGIARRACQDERFRSWLEALDHGELDEDRVLAVGLRRYRAQITVRPRLEPSPR
jgi:hypothetical protein